MIFKNFLIKSGINEEIVFIKNIIPFNKKIFIFLLILPISFIISFIIFFTSYFFFVIFFLIFIIKKIFKKNFSISINYFSQFTSTKLFFISEFFINYPQSKSFLIFYKILELFYLKKNNKKRKFKYKLFSYLFKRLFYFLTLIPFIVLKLNCILFKEIISLKKWSSDSFDAYLDNFFFNLYVTYILEYINIIKTYKVICINTKISFNPPKKDNFFFKGFYDYLKKKQSVEDLSEFRILNSRNNENLNNKKHYSKIYEIYNDSSTEKKSLAFNETKSKIVRDFYGNIIRGKLGDYGSKNTNIFTNKIGPILIDPSKEVLTTIPFSMTKNIDNIKTKFSWNFLQDIFWKENLFWVDEKGILKKLEKDESLKKYYLNNFNKLNDSTKKFVESKIEFDFKNEDIINKIDEAEYEKKLHEDYKTFLNKDSNHFDDFTEKNNFSDDDI